MIVLVGLALFLVAELALRSYHRRIERAYLPVELRAETRWLRREDLRAKQRIVCLGDSITYGESLPYEHSYPALLADQLERAYPALAIAVINAGIGGNTAVLGQARFARDVAWYSPDTVIVNFGINDGHLGHWPLDPVRERRMRGDLYLWERTDALLRHSHVYLTARARTRRALHMMGWQGPHPVSASSQELQPRVSEAGFRMALERLIHDARQAGCAAIFLATMTPVSEPFYSRLGSQEEQRQRLIYDRYNVVIREVALQQAVQLVDLAAAFAGKLQQPSHFNNHAPLLATDGVHLTSEGERLIALEVFERVVALRLYEKAD